MLPTAFWILPAACSALPSDCNLASPTTLPMASLTEPLIPFAAPAIRSLSITIYSCCEPTVRAGYLNEVGRPPRRDSRLLAIPECRSIGRAATSCRARDRSHNRGDRCHTYGDRCHTNGDDRLPRPVEPSRTRSGRCNG